MNRTRFGAVRLPLLGAAVLASFAVSLSAQVVEKGRTYADLVATHPCNSGNSGRLARVTDAQSSSSIGGGGGSTQVWAVCNGVDTWTLTTIGGSGGGVSGLTTADGGTALADNAIVRGDGTTGVQGSTVTVEDSTGNLQWEGTTADGFEGNFTFADPTADWTWNWLAAGAMRGPDGTTALPAYGFASDQNTGIYSAGADTLALVSGGVDTLYVLPTFLSSNVQVRSYENFRLGAAKKLCWSDIANPGHSEQSCLSQGGAAVVTVESTLHLTPIASPPRTCDATAEGDLYSDTSHALCWCDASAWQKLSGAGTCA